MLKPNKRVRTMLRYQTASLSNMQKICTSNTASVEWRTNDSSCSCRGKGKMQCMLGERCCRTLSAGVYGVKDRDSSRLYKYSVAYGDEM